MRMKFAETLKRIRMEKNMSQQQLAEAVFVNRSTVANWETGRRLPDAIMIGRLADCLGVDVGVLLGSSPEASDHPVVAVADDEKMALSISIDILEQTLHGASIVGFTKANELLEYARSNRIDLAFLDIEMGVPSGLELCKELLIINPDTNVVFLTAYKEYAFDAWGSGACGFLTKPLSNEDLKKQLARLRHPIKGL